MYYLFLGDRQRAYKKASEVANTLSNKNIGINLVKVSSSEYSDSQLAEHLNSQALFSAKNIILISGLIADGVGGFLLSNLKELKSSENIFIIADDVSDKKTLEKIEKHAEKVQKFENKIIKKEKDNSVFEVADCFGRRDKKMLWKKYREVLQNHGSVEILTILLWQIRATIAAAQSAGPSDSGLAPYTYTKSKSFAKNFSINELKNIMLILTKMNTESFYSDGYLEPRLEKFFLEY